MDWQIERVWTGNCILRTIFLEISQKIRAYVLINITFDNAGLRRPIIILFTSVLYSICRCLPSGIEFLRFSYWDNVHPLKMKTKQRIIDQAIRSYNEDGLTNVTSRELAKKLGMSHGNLEYHFGNKEALLMAIYKRMKKDISKAYVEMELSENPFLHFNGLLEHLEEFHRSYSFFNLDVLEISRKYPKVNKLLQKTFQVRKEQMSHFYERFKEMGYFKEEILPGMYKRLQHTIRIIITFWNSQKEVLPYFLSAQKDAMSVYIWELLVPHMTETGLEAYKNLITTKTAVQ